MSPDSFCFICGEYTVKRQQRNINDFVKKVYFAYFKLKLGDQDKPWAPHKVCRRCEEDLRLWFKGKKNSFRFGIPMIWREQKNHTTDCYFCSVYVKGFNTKNLGLLKDAAELLGSRLKNKNLLSSGTSFSWYRHREKEFTQFFSKEGHLVFL